MDSSKHDGRRGQQLFRRLLSPRGLFLLVGTGGSLYISYLFSKRIGKPNDRWQRRQAQRRADPPWVARQKKKEKKGDERKKSSEANDAAENAGK